MLDIKCFTCNMLQENCYIVSDDTRQAVVIDCGAYYDEERKAITDYIRQQKLCITHLLCTHGHLDHVFGNDTIEQEFGVGPEIHAADVFLLNSLANQAEELLGVPFTRKVPRPANLLAHADIISFGDHRLKVLHTPGHSPGSVVLYCEEENLLFSGDTLFRLSVGRTDLARGSWEQLIDSLHKVLAPLPAATTVFCGHGPQTRLGDEVRMNPFFR